MLVKVQFSGLGSLVYNRSIDSNTFIRSIFDKISSWNELPKQNANYAILGIFSVTRSRGNYWLNKIMYFYDKYIPASLCTWKIHSCTISIVSWW